jgi:hypothetical protein
MIYPIVIKNNKLNLFTRFMPPEAKDLPIMMSQGESIIFTL